MVNNHVFINFQLTYNFAVVTLLKTLTVITIPLNAYVNYLQYYPITIYANRYTKTTYKMIFLLS